MVVYNSLPQFSGVPRQRGRGFGAFAGTVARTAFPILKKYFFPAAKRIGRDLIESTVPEIENVVSGKSSVRKALKKLASSTLRKQIGGGKRKRRSATKSKKRKNSRKKTIRKHSRKGNSRSDVFRNLQD